MKLSDQITRRHLFVAFGTSQQTGGLSSVDLAAIRDGASVTLTASDGSVAPISGADASSAGVMTAGDKARLDGLPPTTVREFTALADVATAAVGAGITHLRTAGHASGSDGGGALYRRVAAEPAHGLKARSADGAWWEIVADRGAIDVHQAGARGDNAADDTAAIQACLDYAKATGAAITLQKGKVYRVANLVVTDMQNLVLRCGGGMSNNTNAAATLRFHGAAGTTLLYLWGVVHGTIEGVSFAYGSAAPDAYIRTDNGSPGWAATSIDLHKVLFRGNGKADGSIGLDLGPNSTANNADFNHGRIEFRLIQTGMRLNHAQSVAHHHEYIRAIDCGTGIDIVDGGNIKVGTLNCTNNDIDVKVRGGGSNLGTVTIDNAHVEQAPSNATAVFLDAASTGSNGLSVVLNNPIVATNYTGTIIKVGQATHVICNGGMLSVNGTIDCSGTQNDGDAVFIARGARFEGAFTANQWGYYSHELPLQNAGGSSPWGGQTTRSGKALGQSRMKLPAALKQYFVMPLHRPGGSSVSRALPSDAVVTAIDLVVENAGSATGSDKVRVDVGGVTLGQVVVGTAGPRHFGWRANDLDAGDTSTTTLGAPTVLGGLDSMHLVQCIINGGSAANVRTATGRLYVEYVVESVQAAGIDP